MKMSGVPIRLMGGRRFRFHLGRPVSGGGASNGGPMKLCSRLPSDATGGAKYRTVRQQNRKSPHGIGVVWLLPRSRSDFSGGACRVPLRRRLKILTILRVVHIQLALRTVLVDSAGAPS